MWCWHVHKPFRVPQKWWWWRRSTKTQSWIKRSRPYGRKMKHLWNATRWKHCACTFKICQKTNLSWLTFVNKSPNLRNHFMSLLWKNNMVRGQWAHKKALYLFALLFCDVLQEVEEDKKRAEQEGMSLHSRKGKPDDLTITINKSSNVSCFIPAQTNTRHSKPDDIKSLALIVLLNLQWG